MIDNSHTAILALSSGEVFYGRGIGAEGKVFGEICFNTAITGYQEILTDPSYAGQIITFTFPHIGNVGVNNDDNESHKKPTANGLVIREEITNSSSWRAIDNFNEWLKNKGVTGISGIDTRALTKKIREGGAQNVAIGHGKIGRDFSLEEILELAKNNSDLGGKELTEAGSTKEVIDWKGGLWRVKAHTPKYKIAAIDYGFKENTARNLANVGCEVEFFGAKTPAAEILACKPDGFFLSNGAGDPAATAKFAVPIIQELLASGKPLFGICMGHQLLATALGCATEKMHQGHRGANHPVQDLNTKKVEITSQNHGFVVSENVPKNVTITHRSLFDGSIAGISCTSGNINAFSVQYHPEASPGPHDSHYLFERFSDMIAASEKKKTA
jgi:carbamoyl-phosphate synthase small subunit